MTYSASVEQISRSSLYPYQRDGVTGVVEILSRRRGALLADPPGAGKTPQAVLVAADLRASRILVVCPASLCENWRREFLRWWPCDERGPIQAHVLTSRTTREQLFAWNSSQNHAVIVSYDYAARHALELTTESEARRSVPIAWNLMICDESHALKSPASQRARAVLVSIYAQVEKILCMTGTPIPNGRAAEAFTVFRSLAPDLFHSWDEYAERYCVRADDQWGNVRYPRSKNLKELGEIARREFMVRRSREEVLGQLPPLVRQVLPLEVSRIEVAAAEGPLAGRDRNAVAADVVSAIDAGAIASLLQGPLSTVRRELGALKIAPAVEYIKTLLEELGEESSVVVFCHHRAVYDGLRDGLSENFEVVGIQGASTAEERSHAVDRFQSGQARIFLGSLLAAGTGLTLTRSSVVVFVEADWVPSTNEQAEGRIYRVTQTEITRAIYLVVPDSLDESMQRSVMAKQKNVRKVMGEAA